MATERANFHRFELTFTALIALLPQFLGTNPMKELAAPLHHVLCSVAAYFFGKLPGIVFAVVQSAETCTLHHAGLVFVVQELARFWSLLRLVSPN